MINILIYKRKPTSIRKRVGKANMNSFESVSMTTGGATKFLTDRSAINAIQQMNETVRAGQSPGPRNKIN